MKTQDPKLVALLERIGWTEIELARPFGEDVILGIPPKGLPLPEDGVKTLQVQARITHDLMDEVWEWMKKQPSENIRIVYGEKLEIVAKRIVYDTGGNLWYVLPNLTASQKFEACCNALGIE